MMRMKHQLFSWCDPPKWMVYKDMSTLQMDDLWVPPIYRNHREALPRNAKKNMARFYDQKKVKEERNGFGVPYVQPPNIYDLHILLTKKRHPLTQLIKVKKKP